jgi:hypothetical protein
MVAALGTAGVSAEGVYPGGESENPASPWYANLVPFVAGVAAGLLPLWILALRGLPAGATARAIAALARIPPYAAVTIAATLLRAALQALAGAWLARALAPAGGQAQPAISDAKRMRSAAS